MLTRQRFDCDWRRYWFCIIAQLDRGWGELILEFSWFFILFCRPDGCTSRTALVTALFATFKRSGIDARSNWRTPGRQCAAYASCLVVDLHADHWMAASGYTRLMVPCSTPWLDIAVVLFRCLFPMLASL